MLANDKIKTENINISGMEKHLHSNTYKNHTHHTQHTLAHMHAHTTHTTCLQTNTNLNKMESLLHKNKLRQNFNNR